MTVRPWALASVAGIIVLTNRLVTGDWSRWTFTALAAATVLSWLLARRCAHQDATLQPPVRGEGPDRDHARWYCDRCGKIWDAGLEPTTRPRVIYYGFDEHKASLAATRAESVERQRRKLATKRAGGGRQPTRPVGHPGPQRVRPLEQTRPRAVELLDRPVVDHAEERASPVAAIRRGRR